jgi:hypothetical protein
MNGNWRERLRGDPAPWLLDYADNPSVYFWFLRDIVGRPEDAPALLDARDRILYSAPVQEVFAAQDESGFWGNPDSLDTPRYRATLWSLALLAELGVPRASRRARAASEFVLQNHLAEDGSFAGLSDSPQVGLLMHALLYFRNRQDARLAPAIERLAEWAAEGDVFALWALTEIPREQCSPTVQTAVVRGADKLLDALACGDYPTFGAFPSFDGNDALLALRVLTRLGCANDSRTNAVIEKIWERQGEGARWQLEKSYNGWLAARVEEIGTPSKWATLNVLRVVVGRQVDR